MTSLAAIRERQRSMRLAHLRQGIAPLVSAFPEARVLLFGSFVPMSICFLLLPRRSRLQSSLMLCFRLVSATTSLPSVRAVGSSCRGEVILIGRPSPAMHCRFSRDDAAG